MSGDALLAGSFALAGVVVGAAASELLEWRRRRRVGRAAVESLWREVADADEPVGQLLENRKFAPHEPTFVFPTFSERQAELAAILTIEELDLLARVLGLGSARMMTAQYQQLQAEARAQGFVSSDHPALTDLRDWRVELTRVGRLLANRRYLLYSSRFSRCKEIRVQRAVCADAVRRVIREEKDRLRQLLEQRQASSATHVG